VSTEPTPAVERATRAAAHRAGVGFAALDSGTQDLHRDVTRAGLAAALDAEEMACELFVADSGQERAFALGIWRAAPDDQAVKKHWRRIAAALRASILGVEQ
jgi:hypothetical protein